MIQRAAARTLPRRGARAAAFHGHGLGAGGLRVHTWRDANVIHKVSIHLTLIVKAYGVSRFTAVVTVPDQCDALTPEIR